MNMHDPKSIRIAELEEELLQLRAMIKPKLVFPEHWNLTARHAEVLAVFYAAWPQWVNRHRLAASIWGYEERTDKLVDVTIYYLRRRLRPFGLVIRNQCGLGWVLADKSHALIKKALS